MGRISVLLADDSLIVREGLRALLDMTDDVRVVGMASDYDELIGAYEAAGGGIVDRGALLWWETLGTLKWGIMCILQATATDSACVAGTPFT